MTQDESERAGQGALLSADRLAGIAARAGQHPLLVFDETQDMAMRVRIRDAFADRIVLLRHAAALAAEVERLRTENAAMREIVQAVAHASGGGMRYTDNTSCISFAGTGTASEIEIKARALLAAEEGGQS